MNTFESIQGYMVPIGARSTSAVSGCGTIYATRQALSQTPASPNGRAIPSQNSLGWTDSRKISHPPTSIETTELGTAGP